MFTLSYKLGTAKALEAVGLSRKTAAEKVETPHELFARAQSVRARMLPVMRREQKKLRALNLTGVPISSVAMGINLPDEGGSDIDLNIGTKNLVVTSKKLEAVGFPHTATEHGYNIHKYQTPEGYDVELKVRHQHEVDYQRSAAKRISALPPIEKQKIIAQKYELRGDPAAYKKAKIDFYITHGLIPPGGDWSKVTPKTPAAYHGSPTAGISTLEPRLDPRTGKTSLFTSKHPEHAAIHALLADRATANITHQTKGGKFISGHAITKEDLLPHGYLYELPGSGGELSKATKPTSSKKITVADLKNMGWTFEKKASTKEYVRIQVDGGLQHHYLNAEKWDHPAGKIEVGETPEQAARRELIERTGYAVVGKLQPLGRDGLFHVFSAQQVKKVGPPQTEIRWQVKNGT